VLSSLNSQISYQIFHHVRPSNAVEYLRCINERFDCTACRGGVSDCVVSVSSILTSNASHMSLTLFFSKVQVCPHRRLFGLCLRLCSRSGCQVHHCSQRFRERARCPGETDVLLLQFCRRWQYSVGSELRIWLKEMTRRNNG
jgi:hypothetical protein